MSVALSVLAWAGVVLAVVIVAAIVTMLVGVVVAIARGVREAKHLAKLKADRLATMSRHPSARGII